QDMPPQLNCNGIVLFHYAIETRVCHKKSSRPCGFTISSPPKLTPLWPLLFHIHLFLSGEEETLFYLPCSLSVDSLLQSYSTINIFASHNSHLPGLLGGFLVKISDINKLYQPENLLLYLNTMRDYKFGSDKVIIDGLQIFKMCPSLARDHVYMEAIVCVEDKQMSEFFFHLMRNQRLPSSKGFLQTCGQHELHQFLKKSRISTTVLLGPVFLGNKGLNDVENDELPRLVYVLVRREPN
ncbi:hypothetical protein IGI04_031574, partial [Brassica rapa subsp. trilocularis]